MRSLNNTVSVYGSLVLAIFFMNICSVALGSDRVVEEMYTVRINDVPLTRDAAETVLLRSMGGKVSIKAYDNIKKMGLVVNEVTRGMDINISGSDLVSGISNMYDNYLKSNRNKEVEQYDNITKVARTFPIMGVKTTLTIYIDREKVVTSLVVIQH